MEKLIQISSKLIAQSKPSYIRNYYEDYDFKQRLSGFVGARGVGKTTFLLYALKNLHKQGRKVLYVSVDNILLSETRIWDLAEDFVNLSGGEYLCLDEIHKYKNWNQELKNIYDSFPKLKVIFFW